MRIEYTKIRDSIKSTLATDPRLDTTDLTNRYVVQMLNQRWLPGAGLPAILIYIENKAREPHEAIGYAPFPYLTYTIKPIIAFPPNTKSGAEETPVALLNKLGLTTIQTPEHADNAIQEITDTIEEIIRGNNTTLDKNRYLNNNQIKVALPISTNFGFVKGENSWYVFSEVSLQIQMRLT